MLTRVRGEDASFTDVKIKTQDREIRLGGVSDVMNRRRGMRILGI